jgi:hypothetical protein
MPQKCNRNASAFGRAFPSPHHLQQIVHPGQPDPAPAPGQSVQQLIAGTALHLQHPGAGAGRQQSGALQEFLAQGCAIVAKLAVGMAQQRLEQGLRLGLFGIAEGGFQAIGGLGQGAANAGPIVTYSYGTPPPESSRRADTWSG